MAKSYTLHITSVDGTNVKNYESVPAEMIPVPPVDSIYYEKLNVKEGYMNFGRIDACQIYLDTHDPQNAAGITGGILMKPGYSGFYGLWKILNAG